jgi:collagen type III alpha
MYAWKEIRWLLVTPFVVMATSQVALGQINYRWNRTAQTLGVRSNVTVTAQGDSVGGGNARQTTTQDAITLNDTRGINRLALGGEGGGGGDSGELVLGWRENARNGAGGFPFDGPDGGHIGDALSAGQGGEAGASGYADASGTTVAIDELNSNMQTIVSYSWIHNQWGDVDLLAAGGGGGGGAGTDGPTHDGGNGGDGGPGDSAVGTVTAVQDSDVNVTVACVWAPGTEPDPPDPDPPFIDCSITLDMGWVSAANPDWIGTGAGGAAWARSIDVAVVAGLSSVLIQGGPTGPVTVTAFDDTGTPYFKESDNPMESDTGSFGLGPGEIGITRTRPGEGAEITSLTNGINSTLTGSMTAAGGQGGERGYGTTQGVPRNGADGEDGGEGLGAAGGAGGAGGEPRPGRLGGGRGGKGGDGDHIEEHKDGIYQGVIEIMLG